MTLFDLTGKVALVTGATKGIGRGIAERLAQHGAKVIVSSRTQAEAEQVATELSDAYGRDVDIATGLRCDINDLEDVERFAKAACGVWNGLDILVCNASFVGEVGPSRATPVDQFNQVLTTNIHHNFRLCQALRNELAVRKGAIILIGSISGHTSSPATLAYGVSKAGVAHMALSLADEFAPQGIRVNCVAPGLIRSFSSGAAFGGTDKLEAASASIPIGRIGEPDDIAGAVVFLASAAGSYVTGTTIHVDGGRARFPVRSIPIDA